MLAIEVNVHHVNVHVTYMWILMYVHVDSIFTCIILCGCTCVHVCVHVYMCTCVCGHVDMCI